MGDKKRLGDWVEQFIDTVAPRLAKRVKEKEGGCGCGKRKETLNKWDKKIRG